MSTTHPSQTAAETTPLLSQDPAHKKYSIFTNNQKRWIILTAALASSFSPFSANIYYPSLNSIAKDLRVSSSQINLTITTYMICQGLAPAFMGSFADQAGRRPAYILCFVIYICGNIALALQHSFPALLILRAVQSCGSSGTVALASAVAADIITSAERGTYMGLASLGNILAPSLGPILGGLLSQYLGWQAVFWFLAIAALVFFIPFLVFLPETCRGIVGDGSVPPPKMNMSLWNCWALRHHSGEADSGLLLRTKRASKSPNPLATFRLLFQLPVGLILLANGITFASYYSVTAGMPAHFKKMYDLNDMEIGFSFIPLGLGSLVSALLNGYIVDANYHRLRTRHGFRDAVAKGQKQDHSDFPIERARLQVGIPMTFAAAGCIAAYGTLLALEVALPVSLFMVFFISFCVTAAYNVMNVLIVDLKYTMPATAMAANNLVRCFLGAAATAVVNPVIGLLGSQVTYLLVGLSMVVVSPLLFVVYARGLEWRMKARMAMES